MVKKADAKAVLVVTAGVMLAGYLMFTFRDVALVAQTSRGFNL